jgi:hypothetical protein
MAKPDETPKHVKVMEKVRDSYTMADLIADTTEVDMGKDFHEALDEIRDKNGRIDYRLFDPAKNGDKYHHLVVDKYVGKLKKRLTDKMGKEHKFSEPELNLMMENMYGTTKRMYMDTLAKNGSKFRISEYKANLAEHVKELRGKLYSQAQDHISTDQHVAILKELTAKNKGLLDLKDTKSLENPLFRDEISALIRHYYDSNGNVSRDLVDQLPQLKRYLTKESEMKYLHQLKNAA